MKKLLLGLILLALSILFIGCSENEVSADIPSGFSHLTKDSINSGKANVIQHNKTGCYFIMGTGNYDTTVALTQMFIEKDGVSIPYCD